MPCVGTATPARIVHSFDMSATDWRGTTPSWDETRPHWQKVRNERPIPPRDTQRSIWPPIQVTAWVVWEHDGLELIDTTAHFFAGKDVQVELVDGRREQIKWVWLASQDVRRR